MKKLLIMIFLSIPLASMAQNGWERVLTEKEKQEQIEKAEAAAKKARKDAEKQAKKSKKQIKAEKSPLRVTILQRYLHQQTVKITARNTNTANISSPVPFRKLTAR